jgi:hypothetical protein
MHFNETYLKDYSHTFDAVFGPETTQCYPWCSSSVIREQTHLYPWRSSLFIQEKAQLHCKAFSFT